MIKVSVLYPHTEGQSFNVDYYVNKHMPMVREKLGLACKGMAVEHGIAGATSKSPPTYICMGHMYFESIDAYKAAFKPIAADVMADVGNYTAIHPVIQVSDVKMS